MSERTALFEGGPSDGKTMVLPKPALALSVLVVDPDGREFRANYRPTDATFSKPEVVYRFTSLFHRNGEQWDRVRDFDPSRDLALAAAVKQLRSVAERLDKAKSICYAHGLDRVGEELRAVAAECREVADAEGS